MSLAVQTSFNRSYQYWSGNSKAGRGDDDFEKNFMGKATSRTTSSDKGKNIGVMTIGDRGFIAKYADSSTEEEPIIKVGDYEVRVNDVNPKNATKVEMFALMSYMDDKGLTENTGMKSFNKMMAYSSQAEYNGFCSGIYDTEAAWSKNRDWMSILKNAEETFFDIPETHRQGLDCQKILTNLTHRMGEDGAEKAIEKESGYGADDKTDLLTARYTSFIWKGQVTDPDTGKVITSGYIDRNFYTKEGIISSRSSHNSKEGTIKDRYNWKVDFDSDDDYERTMSFLDRIPEGDNSIFTTREAFWKDFVSGEIDEDEFFEFYETLDHGIANFIKQDEKGKNYIDNEMMNSKYFKYFGLQQVTVIPWEDMQKGLEQSALRDRGYVHENPKQDNQFNVYDALKDAFASSGTEKFRFADEDSYFSLDEWVREIISRAHMGLMDSLFVA